MSIESSSSSPRFSNNPVESWIDDGPNGQLKIDVHHPNEDTDLNQSPLVIIPGYTNGRETMTPLARRAANMGFQAITFSYERHTKPETDPITHKVLTAEAVALSAMKRFKSESIQVKGFSYGGNGAVELASRAQHEQTAIHVDKVSLDAPLGVVQGSMIDAIVRGSQEISRFMNPLDLRHIGERTLICAQSLRYILDNPKLTLEELVAAQGVNTFKKIEDLHNNGLPIGVVGLTNDKLFPAHKLWESMPVGVPFDAIKGTHIDYLHNPSIQKDALEFHDKLHNPSISSVA